MPCWAWVAPPPFDASSLLGCCPQSHEILLNKGMKYWDSALNAQGVVREHFIATVHIAAAVIGWKRSGKERTGQTQFSTKFAAKLSFMPLKKKPLIVRKKHKKNQNKIFLKKISQTLIVLWSMKLLMNWYQHFFQCEFLPRSRLYSHFKA